MAITPVLRNNTSRIGPGYVVQLQGLVGTISQTDWCQVYVVPPGGSPATHTIMHGNVVCHGSANPFVVLGARELVSVATADWHFQLHAAIEDEMAIDGYGCSLVAEHYNAVNSLVETATVTSLVYDRWGDLGTLFAAIAHFGEGSGALARIEAAVRRTYTS